LIGIGAGLGVNTRPFSVLSALLGFLCFGLLAALLAYLARFTSYDAAVIGWFTVAGIGLAAVLAGFAVAWGRKRLAFVELAMIALLAGYVFYLTAAAGPPEW